MSRAIKLCHVPQFSATIKPIEPQGHLSKPNKISECYDISKYYDLKISRNSAYDLYFLSNGLNIHFFVSIATEECIDIPIDFQIFWIKAFLLLFY